MGCQSGGIGRLDDDGVVSPCDPIAERECKYIPKKGLFARKFPTFSYLVGNFLIFGLTGTVLAVPAGGRIRSRARRLPFRHH